MQENGASEPSMEIRGAGRDQTRQDGQGGGEDAMLARPVRLTVHCPCGLRLLERAALDMCICFLSLSLSLSLFGCTGWHREGRLGAAALGEVALAQQYFELWHAAAAAAAVVGTRKSRSYGSVSSSR